MVTEELDLVTHHKRSDAAGELPTSGWAPMAGVREKYYMVWAHILQKLSNRPPPQIDHCPTWIDLLGS